jgi:predicted nucleotidyltransferase
MEKWEIALNKFIATWKNKKEVIGFLVCGSYVTGNPSKHSDIDLHIILSDKTNWRERGNKIIDGYLIEYFANPIKQIKSYMKNSFNENTNMEQVQFATGKIIIDKTKDVKKLKLLAKNYMKKKFSKPSKISIELNKYFLNESIEKLQELYETNSKSFEISYYNKLLENFNLYSKFISERKYKAHKIYELLTTNAKKKYLLKEYKDKTYLKLFLNCINAKTNKQKILSFKNITTYALNKMGKFNIDGWKIKTPLDLK